MNEPVAWRTHYPSGWEYKDGNPPFELKGNSQLLYINPVKLTDEDIWKTIIEGGFYDCVVDWLSMPCEEDRANLKRDLIRLARAILRKASEK